MTTTHEPDWLPGYLASRDQERAERRNAALAALTERERRLVREFAVMGFVQGRMGSRDAPFPKDSAILAWTIDGLLSNAGEAFTEFRMAAELAPERCACGVTSRGLVDGVCADCRDTNVTTCEWCHGKGMYSHETFETGHRAARPCPRCKGNTHPSKENHEH